MHALSLALMPRRRRKPCAWQAHKPTRCPGLRAQVLAFMFVPDGTQCLPLEACRGVWRQHWFWGRRGGAFPGADGSGGGGSGGGGDGGGGDSGGVSGSGRGFNALRHSLSKHLRHNGVSPPPQQQQQHQQEQRQHQVFSGD